MEGRIKAIDRLQGIEAELAALSVVLKNCGIETDALGIIREAIVQMLATTRTLWQGIDPSRSSPDKPLVTLLIDEQMRRASELIENIGKNLGADRIRTDQEALSMYLQVLNQATEQVDRIFGGLKAED